jgi:hypothetical protein
MAVATDVFELVHEYRLNNQVMNNVYNYQREDIITANAQDLAERWVVECLPEILQLQVADCQTTAVRTRNLFNAADTGEVLLASNGTGYLTGNSHLPSFVSAGFTLARDTAVTKNGAKRIGGTVEEVITDGVYTDATFLTRLGQAADAVLEEVTSGVIDWFFPVIVKRIDEGGGNYRLPANTAEAIVNAVVDVLFSIIPTTQNSRKIGVGE